MNINLSIYYYFFLILFLLIVSSSYGECTKESEECNPCKKINNLLLNKKDLENSKKIIEAISNIVFPEKLIVHVNDTPKFKITISSGMFSTFYCSNGHLKHKASGFFPIGTPVLVIGKYNKSNFSYCELQSGIRGLIRDDFLEPIEEDTIYLFSRTDREVELTRNSKNKLSAKDRYAKITGYKKNPPDSKESDESSYRKTINKLNELYKTDNCGKDYLFTVDLYNSGAKFYEKDVVTFCDPLDPAGGVNRNRFFLLNYITKQDFGDLFPEDRRHGSFFRSQGDIIRYLNRNYNKLYLSENEYEIWSNEKNLYKLSKNFYHEYSHFTLDNNVKNSCQEYIKNYLFKNCKLTKHILLDYGMFTQSGDLQWSYDQNIIIVTKNLSDSSNEKKERSKICVSSEDITNKTLCIDTQELVNLYAKLYGDKLPGFEKVKGDSQKRVGKIWKIRGYDQYYKWKYVIEDFVGENYKYYDDVHGKGTTEGQFEDYKDFVSTLIMSHVFLYEPKNKKRR